MKHLLCVFLLLPLIGCGKNESERPYVSNYQLIEIIDIKRPKHYRMTYKILKTNQYVEVRSKHCNDWDRVTVGKIYNADINASGCNVVRSIK